MSGRFLFAEGCLHQYNSTNLGFQLKESKLDQFCAVLSWSFQFKAHWFPIDCDKPIRADLICVRRKPPNAIETFSFASFAENTTGCDKRAILFQREWCYVLQSTKSNATLSSSAFRQELTSFDSIIILHEFKFSIIMQLLSRVSKTPLLFGFLADKTSEMRTPGALPQHLVPNASHFELYQSGWNKAFKNITRDNATIYHDIKDFTYYQKHCKSPKFEHYNFCMTQGLTSRVGCFGFSHGCILFGYKPQVEAIFYKFDFVQDKFVRQETNGPNYQTLFMTKSRSDQTKFEPKKKELQVFVGPNDEILSLLNMFNRVPHYRNRQKLVGFDCPSSGRESSCVCPVLTFKRRCGGCSPYAYQRKSKQGHWLFQVNFFNQTSTFFQQSAHIHEAEQIKKHFYPLYSDCSKAELTQTVTVASVTSLCAGSNQIKCTHGCSRCFPVHKFCVYELDRNGGLMHCPSGSHLWNCSHMECNNMFKCPNSYCVPFRYFHLLDPLVF